MIVPTIETTIIKPIGTKTVTPPRADFQRSVPGSPSTPSRESTSAPIPRIASTAAPASRSFPAVCTREA